MRKQRDLKKWVCRGERALRHPGLLSGRIRYNCARFISDNLSAVGCYDYPYRIIFLAGMALSGSTWMQNLLARIPGYYTRYWSLPDDVAYRQDFTDSGFSRIPRHGYTLMKTHLNPTIGNLGCIRRNGVEKVLITYRDLRSVAVSRYCRLAAFPKAKNAFDFIDYRALGKEKALDNSIEVVGSAYVSWIRAWFEIAKQDSDQYHFVKFEDLKKDTKGEFRKVLRFYEIELSDEKVDKIIEMVKGKGTMKQNIMSAKLVPHGYASNFRMGKIDEWQSELSDTQIGRCKELMGDVLIELGYEKDLNW